MIAKKISETEYSVELSLSDNTGVIKQLPDEMDSDELYWMFYPDTLKPICCGDLKKMSDFLSELNRG